MGALYKGGYKYQLQRDEFFKVDIFPKCNIETDFFEIRSNGTLIARRGYAWDGPSGPTIDTKNFMRGSLVHDILYQAMSEGILDVKWRMQADKELVKCCKEDGMSAFRRWYVYLAVRCFGGNHLVVEKTKET
jgi:hypothetical protein